LDLFRQNLVDIQHLDIKDECCSSRDDCAESTVTVREMRWDRELSLFTNTHVYQTLVPSFNHVAGAQLKVERLVTVKTRIKLGAVREESPSVVDRDVISALAFASARVSWLCDLYLEVRGPFGGF